MELWEGECEKCSEGLEGTVSEDWRQASCQELLSEGQRLGGEQGAFSMQRKTQR